MATGLEMAREWQQRWRPFDCCTAGRGCQGPDRTSMPSPARRSGLARAGRIRESDTPAAAWQLRPLCRSCRRRRRGPSCGVCMAFANQVAVVTGASSGIGWDLARELARQGGRVGLVARRADKLVELAGAIRAAGGTVAFAA